MNRNEMKKLVESNKWYTFDEAEAYLRKHWNLDNEKNGKYLEMNRRQIQKILRSDIIGTYLGIDKKVEGLTDNEIFLKGVYGWKSKETFDLDVIDKENDGYVSKTYTEELSVFPKYDRVHLENEVSIILSIWDEQLGDNDKMEMREIYEDIYKPKLKGKTPYLMTEAYLFALKHEIERREYPTRKLRFEPHTPKRISETLSEDYGKDDITACIDYFLDDFNERILKSIRIHNDARKVEEGRYYNLYVFFHKWSGIYDEIIKKVIGRLIDEGILDEFKEILKGFAKEFTFNLDIEMGKSKLHDKFTNQELSVKPDSNVEQMISRSIYSYEKYNLEKLESAIFEDEKFISEASFFRKRFGESLRNYVSQFSSEDSLLLDSLDNLGSN